LLMLNRTSARFKITPAEADNFERAAEIVVGKMKERMLEKLRKTETTR